MSGLEVETAEDANRAFILKLKLAAYLNNSRGLYDYILIDTPPVLSVPDARIIGANSDANIYIVEWNKTTQAQVVQGFDMFSSIGVDITGFVLNQINPYKIKNYGYISPYGYNAYGSEYYES